VVIMLEGDPMDTTEALARAADHALHVARSAHDRADDLEVRAAIAHTTSSKTRSTALLMYHAVFELAVVSPSYKEQYEDWARDHKAFIKAINSTGAEREQPTEDFRMLAAELERAVD
jgi:hypothetical protein